MTTDPIESLSQLSPDQWDRRCFENAAYFTTCSPDRKEKTQHKTFAEACAHAGNNKRVMVYVVTPEERTAHLSRARWAEYAKLEEEGIPGFLKRTPGEKPADASPTPAVLAAKPAPELSPSEEFRNRHPLTEHDKEVIAKLENTKEVKAERGFKNRISRKEREGRPIPGAKWDTSKSRWVHPALETSCNATQEHIMKDDDANKTETTTTSKTTKEDQVSSKPKKAKTKKAGSAKKAKVAKVAKTVKAKKANGELRAGSKMETIKTMLSRKTGASAAELCKALGWKAISVSMRAKDVGLKLTKERDKEGVVRYTVLDLK